MSSLTHSGMCCLISIHKCWVIYALLILLHCGQIEYTELFQCFVSGLNPLKLFDNTPDWSLKLCVLELTEVTLIGEHLQHWSVWVGTYCFDLPCSFCWWCS